MKIELKKYQNEIEKAINLIKKFWLEHNNYVSSYEEAYNDLEEWTKKGHYLYFISFDNEYVGFIHLGSRGCEADWLEDIFVLPEYQRRGIGTKAIQLLEEIVKEYSESLYIEVAARNDKAIKLYKRNGYDTLNTITIRKDFSPNSYEIQSKEQLIGTTFNIKNKKTK